MSYPGLDANQTGGVIAPYQSDFFVTPPYGDYQETATTTISTSICVPIYIENSISIDGVSIRAKTGATAYSGWKFGLYNIDSATTPAGLGTAVIEASALTSGGAGTNTVHAFTSTPISRGVYWLALGANAGSGDVCATQTNAGGAATHGIFRQTSIMTGSYDITATTEAPGGFTVTGNAPGAAVAFNGQTNNWPICGLRVV